MQGKQLRKLEAELWRAVTPEFEEQVKEQAEEQVKEQVSCPDISGLNNNYYYLIKL